MHKLGMTQERTLGVTPVMGLRIINMIPDLQQLMTHQVLILGEQVMTATEVTADKIMSDRLDQTLKRCLMSDLRVCLWTVPHN